MTTRIDITPAYVDASLDGIDFIQQLRRDIGADPETEVQVHLSAASLDTILSWVEAALRARDDRGA
ncbi:hypothetical protein [Deinococcus rufus]|uniref:Acyl carrier protein n=1 Tax=Deinococcus rufus TaxID=2136097 RepID=A0ABV7ZBJ9_9DEIO